MSLNLVKYNCTITAMIRIQPHGLEKSLSETHAESKSIHHYPRPQKWHSENKKIYLHKIVESWKDINIKATSKM